MLSKLAMSLLTPLPETRPTAEQALDRLEEALEEDAEKLTLSAPQAEAVMDFVEANATTEEQEMSGSDEQASEPQVGFFREHGRSLAWVAVFGVLSFVLIRVVETNSSLARSVEQAITTSANIARGFAGFAALMAQRIEGASPAETFAAMAAGGLKLPEKPEPDWVLPSADGRCYNSQTGELMRGTAVFNGICFYVSVLPSPDSECPDDSFNPPSDAKPEQKRWCLNPIKKPKPKPRSADPAPKPK
jgi:hypothetical protein